MIREECQAVAQLLPRARLLVDDAATLDRLKTHGPASRYLHIGSHGIFRAGNPLFSSLLLGDTRLCVFDLPDLRLDADLVRLSGCSTGVHEISGAGEILGLSRGLLLAGARAVHVSLWEVNDASTTEYMVRLYRYLTAGLSPAAAMRNAMLELRRTRPHPYFWAPFAYIGKLHERLYFPDTAETP